VRCAIPPPRQQQRQPLASRYMQPATPHPGSRHATRTNTRCITAPQPNKQRHPQDDRHKHNRALSAAGPLFWATACMRPLALHAAGDVTAAMQNLSRPPTRVCFGQTPGQVAGPTTLPNSAQPSSQPLLLRAALAACLPEPTHTYTANWPCTAVVSQWPAGCARTLPPTPFAVLTHSPCPADQVPAGECPTPTASAQQPSKCHNIGKLCSTTGSRCTPPAASRQRPWQQAALPLAPGLGTARLP
jgi:hypothetical protein